MTVLLRVKIGVKSMLDQNQYETGIKVSDDEMVGLNIRKANFLLLVFISSIDLLIWSATLWLIILISSIELFMSSIVLLLIV